MTDSQGSGKAREMASTRDAASAQDSPSSTERRAVVRLSRRKLDHVVVESHAIHTSTLPDLIRELSAIYESWHEDQAQAQRLLTQLQDSLKPQVEHV